MKGKREMKTYLVSAKHVHPDYCFDRHPVRVSKNEREGTFYASAAKLGCGKDYHTEHDAIRALFRDHACTVTKIAESDQ
jgi:hypothetical protein